MSDCLYQYELPGGSHWSFKVRKGIELKITDVEGGGNLGLLMYNPENLLEKYNAPDTLKCQHTFKLRRGHCLYTDMGRVICSITQDDFNWHDTVCGFSNAEQVENKWGARDYQTDRNEWHQNGFDAFLVELSKYGLSARDLAANINLFSKTIVDSEGNLSLDCKQIKPGATVTLRFEMDALVIAHSCPHPLNEDEFYPFKPINIAFYKAAPVLDNDFCMNFCEENKRGFENNRLYYLVGK